MKPKGKIKLCWWW